MCGRELFKLCRVSTLKFEKVCGREFFELLRVSTLKFEVCGREDFQVVQASSFKCVKESFLLMLQVLSQISSLCKKVFQMFEIFLQRFCFVTYSNLVGEISSEVFKH